jgi:hypothetical protein
MSDALEKLIGVPIIREPLIVGCKDKDGNPVHAVMLNGRVYMVPEYYDRLLAEVAPTPPAPHPPAATE